MIDLSVVNWSSVARKIYISPGRTMSPVTIQFYILGLYKSEKRLHQMADVVGCTVEELKAWIRKRNESDKSNLRKRASTRRKIKKSRHTGRISNPLQLVAVERQQSAQASESYGLSSSTRSGRGEAVAKHLRRSRSRVDTLAWLHLTKLWISFR